MARALTSIVDKTEMHSTFAVLLQAQDQRASHTLLARLFLSFDFIIFIARYHIIKTNLHSVPCYDEGLPSSHTHDAQYVLRADPSNRRVDGI